MKRLPFVWVAVAVAVSASTLHAEQAPRDPEAIEARVRALLREDRWRQAVEEASGAPAALGEALFRAGRLDEVEGALAGELELEAPAGRSLATLGRLRDAEGRFDEAVELMGRAVEAAPGDRDVLYWASGATSTRAEAAARLERYLELAEGDREERADAASGYLRLTAELGERQVWIPEARPERVELPLRRIWDPATGTTQGFVLEVGLGDKEKRVKLLLDSGSPGLYLIRRLAKKRGFKPLSEQHAYGGGGSGKHRTTRGLFSRLDIGGLRFTDVLATVNKQEMDPTGRYHGLIGLSAFGGYRVTLDLVDDRLILTPGGGELEGEPYWTVNGQMLVRADVEGPRPGLFLFDTGATNTIVDYGLASMIENTTFGPAVALYGFGGQLPGARRVEGIELDFLGLWSEKIAPRTVDLSTRSRVSELEISGFLGLDLFDGRRLVVDTVLRRVAVQ